MNTSSILKLSSAVILSASALFAIAATEPIVAQPATKAAPAAATVTATMKIGVSIPAADHGWTAGVVWWAKECAKLHPEIEWTIATAETPEKQVSDIETLMAKKVDALSASALFAIAATEPLAAQSATKPAPAAAAVTATIKIGVSIPAADHGWTAGVVWWAKECAKLHPEIEWTIATAETPEKQVSDIETLMAKKVDALVILATESAPITPVAEEAHNRGILVVNVDRGFLKPVADIFIEGDNKAFGRKSAEFMVSKLGGKGKATGNIIVLEGIPCTVNTDRVTAALEVFKAEPGIKIVGQQAANWNRQKALEVTETLLQKAGDRHLGLG